MQGWLRYAVLAFALLLAAIWPLTRETDHAAIEGQITNQSGPLAGASVEARNVTGGSVVRAVSDANGYYRLGDLRPGRYSLWITAEGHYSALIERLAVDRGETVRRDVRLNRTVKVSSIETGETP
jgi:hypothetical protein